VFEILLEKILLTKLRVGFRMEGRKKKLSYINNRKIYFTKHSNFGTLDRERTWCKRNMHFRNG
jgi:hypothetical protein